MDIFVSFLLQIVVLCISLFLIFTRIYRNKPTSPRLPPGRKGWPFVGETLEFGRACMSGDPEKFITDRMSKYSPDVFQSSLFGENFAVFCGASGNKFLFSTANESVNTWWPRSLLESLNFPFDVEGFKDELDELRAMLPEFLKPAALQRYVPVMDSMAKEHMKIDWSPYEDVKALPLARKYTFAIACRLLINVTDTERVNRFTNLLNLVGAGLISAPIKLPFTAFSRAVKAGKLFHEELFAIIRQRKMEFLEKKGQENVLDVLTRMLLIIEENGREISEKAVAASITGLFIGSYDTTSSTITSTLRYLAESPHAYNEVLKEQKEIAKSKGTPGELLNWDDIQKMRYSWNVACEAMRLAPPGQGAFREVTSELTYAGSTVPKGWKAYWTVASTHKNPKYFPDPEKFDPSRFEGHGPTPYTFVPFGGGPRMCPGKEYARLEILTFIYNMVTKFKWEKLNPNEKIIFSPAPTPVNGLPLRLNPLKNGT